MFKFRRVSPDPPNLFLDAGSDRIYEPRSENGIQFSDLLKGGNKDWWKEGLPDVWRESTVNTQHLTANDN
jgi:hypothetical protein